MRTPTPTCAYVYTTTDGYTYCDRTDVEVDGTVLSCPEHRTTQFIENDLLQEVA